MPKGRLVYDWDNLNTEKEARILKLTQEIEGKIANIPWVINDVTSTSETDALSAAMWKYLQEQIDALSGWQTFLSSWDCTTGLPWSDPAQDPYTYVAWNYYIVSTVASWWWTNYKPHWATYTHWVASTAVETQTVNVWDWYMYDWAQWILQPASSQQIVVDSQLSTTSTNPVWNKTITLALNDKQNTIANLSTIESWAAAWATAVQPNDNITTLTNNAGYQTAWDVASTLLWYQPLLTAADDIVINSGTNTISTKWKTYIYATCDTAFNTRDKVCTTARGNYVPAAWDVVVVRFTQWCWVGSPRLNIDGSWNKDIQIWISAANAATLWLGMDNIAWMFVYDGTMFRTFAPKDSTYSGWTGISIASNVVTNTWVTSVNGSTWDVTINDTKTWTTAPSSPTEWMLWYDTTNDVLKVYDWTNWVSVWWWGWWWTWWSITGTLSDQTDLQDALDDKLESTDLIAGDGINITPVWSDLPNWYTQLQSISSSGTQYILTWINYVSWHTYEFTHRLFVDSSTEASRWSWWNAWGWIMMINQDWIKYSWWGSSSIIGAAWQELELTISVWSSTSTYDYELWWTTWTLDRSNTSLSSYAGNVSYPLFVSTVNNGWWIIYTGSELTGTYYYFEAKDNNVLVRKMYPAKRNADWAIWMYDVVNNTFYTNSWSWTFIAWPAVPVGWVEISVDDSVWTNDNVVAWSGISIDAWTAARLPSWYTELEYVESTGAEYLDSWVTFSQIDKTVIVWNFTQNQWWFRSVLWADNQNASSWQKFAVAMWEWTGWQYYTESVYFVGSWSSWWWVDYVYSSAPVDTNEHTFTTQWTWSTTYLMVDNYVDTIPTSAKTTWVTITLWIFSRHLQASNTFSAQWSKFRLKSMVMYNWTTVVFNWVPAKRNSDDEIWIYDLVSGSFLTNLSWSWGLVWWNAVVFDPTVEISSTVLWFNNLTYDSFTAWTWSSSVISNLTFPSTAKMAFLNWRARDNTNTDLVYACWQVLIVRGLTLVSSFVWWWDWTNYIYWGVWLDTTNSYINYTQWGRTTGAVMDYTVYFYK